MKGERQAPRIQTTLSQRASARRPSFQLSTAPRAGVALPNPEGHHPPGSFSVPPSGSGLSPRGPAAKAPPPGHPERHIFQTPQCLAEPPPGRQPLGFPSKPVGWTVHFPFLRPFEKWGWSDCTSRRGYEETRSHIPLASGKNPVTTSVGV